MKTLLSSFFAGVIALATINHAQASYTPMQISFDNISMSNVSSRSSSNQNYLMDDSMLSEMGPSMMMNSLLSESVWWNGLSGMITMDLGQEFLIEDMVAEVNRINTYDIEYSMNMTDWEYMTTIGPMDNASSTTMGIVSSDSQSDNYLSSMDFSSITARYLRMSATDGSNLYIVSELQAYGTEVSPVPEPSTIILFGMGLLILLGYNYRRQKQTVHAFNLKA